MKQILIVALIAMNIITTGCNNNKSNNTTTTDSPATEDMTRKFGNNSGMPDSSSSLDKPDSAINRSDTPRMTN